MIKYSIHTNSFIGLLLIAFLFSCSAERKNLASKTFHNTTARYNAYFIALEKMNEVERAVVSAHKNNYTQILKILPVVDSSTVSSMKTQLEDCIKKSSIAIQRHQNSKWVDDSYVLIGKARFYEGDFPNAVQTFKFVNTKGEDDHARHEALVNLMRTFVDNKEENNAIAVSDFLKKEKLNRKNLKDLYLTRAHLYQKREDYDNVVGNLILAAPLMKKSVGKARILFIIGQIYQQLGFEAEAYNNYKESLKYSPDYELSFYTKLYMYQVYDLKKSNDVKKVRNYFAKLLKDTKNKEFKDKIYYEMAEFEIKQDNLDKAIVHYNSSITVSTNNPRQKSFSYLKLGRIYYENKKDYELAKLYYDSTIAVMPKDEADYESIKERQVVLTDFVEQLNIIQFQDSLLNLAQMDSADVVAMIDKELEREAARLKKEEAKNKKRSGSSSSSRLNTDNVFANENAINSSAGGSWYFYNQNAVGSGQTEFQRNWGNRRSEDNWRRSNKEAVSTFAQAPNTPGDSAVAEVPGAPSSGAVAKEALLQMIPYKEEEKAVALEKIEKAYYRLGNIYNFELSEKQNAAETFEKLLERFPAIDYEPEILYALYLIYKELENERSAYYRDKVLELHPNSTYAKIIKNPNYKQESDLANEKIKVIYREAFEQFEKGELEESSRLISIAINDFPETDFRDYLKLLEILIIGKKENIHNYQFALKNFVKDYKESSLVPYAQKLLKASEDLTKKIAEEKGAQYIQYFEQNHFLILMYPSEKNLADELPDKIEKFNESQFAATNLKTANLKFDNNRSIIIVTEFKDKDQALKYYDKLNSEETFNSGNGIDELENFVISKDNFQIFYQTKDFKNYLAFFKKHYK
ncbi:hypothetical protein BH23BAC1_BH23BAC1_01760 [soil metagenome]